MQENGRRTCKEAETDKRNCPHTADDCPHRGAEKPLTEYDENLFDLTVKEIRISEKHDITFCLRNGLKLTEKEGGDRDAVAHADRI